MSLLRSLGKRPAGPRLQRILRSSHYRDGSFQNPVPTEVTLKDTTIWKMLKEYRDRPADSTPPQSLPSVRTDLTRLPAGKATVVWFGHSSYLLKLGPTHILVDPVFSGNASPFSFFARAYPGADIYKPADMPPTLEAILLTHDHYDHLDYKTIQQLTPRTRHFYTSLGVGAHLEFWGIPAEKITELDWGETVHIDPAGNPIATSKSDNTPDPYAGAITLTATPARHFSGRTFKRGQAAWSSFVLNAPDPNTPATNALATNDTSTTAAAGSAIASPGPAGVGMPWPAHRMDTHDDPPSPPNIIRATDEDVPTRPSRATLGRRLNLFLGGDSGYGPHFQSIGEQYGPFDLTFLECGQYGVHWPNIHMFPEETILAAIDLKAHTLFPVHWAKFTLSLHPWNEPIRRAVAEAKAFNLPITTPRIGQPVNINHDYPMDPWYEPNRIGSGSKT